MKSVKVTLRREGITDDEVAIEIKPNPLSVSETIKHIETKYKLDKIEVLDFGDNKIYIRPIWYLSC